MECDDCPVRFKCKIENTQPRRLVVNKKVSGSCIKCINSKFDKKNGKVKSIGVCKIHPYLIHKDSICEDFLDKSPKYVYRIWKELQEKADRLNKHPIDYCVSEKEL